MLISGNDISLDYAKFPTLFADVPGGVVPPAVSIAADSCTAMLLAELEKPEAEQPIALLAAAYFWGLGLPRDTEKAFHYWKLSAERGSDIGQYMLARMLMSEGKPEEAEKWYKKAYDNRPVSNHLKESSRGSQSAQQQPAESDAAVIHRGTWGDKLSYTIDSDYMLHISGTDNLIGWKYDGGIVRAPWRTPELISKVKSAVIDNGFTTIDMQAFANCTALKSIRLPDSLEDMHIECFGHTAIEELYIPDSVRIILALGEMPALKKISIPGGVKTLHLLNGNREKQANSVLDVHFRGDPPEYPMPDALGPNKVRAYYPASNPKWTQVVRSQFQGNITWIAER